MASSSRPLEDATSGSVQAPNFLDPAERKRLSGPGFRVFLGVCDKLGLSVAQRRRLLGNISETTYYRWRASGVRALSADHLERISLVLGIFKGLRLLFADDAMGLRWLRAPNRDVPFAGRSPLDTMLRGSIDNLFAVRRYIDA